MVVVWVSYILHFASCLYSSGFCTLHSDICIMHHVFTVLHSTPCLYSYGLCIMSLQLWILHSAFWYLHSASCIYSSGFCIISLQFCILHHVFTILHSAYACPQIMHHVCNLIAKCVCLRNYVILRHNLYILLVIVIYYLSAIYMSF